MWKCVLDACVYVLEESGNFEFCVSDWIVLFCVFCNYICGDGAVAIDNTIKFPDPESEPEEASMR